MLNSLLPQQNESTSSFEVEKCRWQLVTAIVKDSIIGDLLPPQTIDAIENAEILPQESFNKTQPIRPTFRAESSHVVLPRSNRSNEWKIFLNSSYMGEDIDEILLSGFISGALAVTTAKRFNTQDVDVFDKRVFGHMVNEPWENFKVRARGFTKYLWASNQMDSVGSEVLAIYSNFEKARLEIVGKIFESVLLGRFLFTSSGSHTQFVNNSRESERNFHLYESATGLSLLYPENPRAVEFILGSEFGLTPEDNGFTNYNNLNFVRELFYNLCNLPFHTFADEVLGCNKAQKTPIQQIRYSNFIALSSVNTR